MYEILFCLQRIKKKYSDLEVGTNMFQNNRH